MRAGRGPRRGRPRPPPSRRAEEGTTMDRTPYLPWLKFIHIAGAIAFVAGHGVSMFMAFRLRSDRDPVRMLAMLDLSAESLGLATIGLLVLLVAGIVDGIVAGYFGRLWIWIALIGLIAIG